MMISENFYKHVLYLYFLFRKTFKCLSKNEVFIESIVRMDSEQEMCSIVAFLSTATASNQQWYFQNWSTLRLQFIFSGQNLVEEKFKNTHNRCIFKLYHFDTHLNYTCLYINWILTRTLLINYSIMASEEKHIKKVIQATNWSKLNLKRIIKLPTDITNLVFLSVQLD